MLDLGMTEILVIGVVALIVVGPKDLPRMLRTLGQYTGKMRGMAREFKRSMDDAAREADLDEFKDIQKSLNDVKAISSDAARAVQQGINKVDSDIKQAASDAEDKSVPPGDAPAIATENIAEAKPEPAPAEPKPEKPAAGAT